MRKERKGDFLIIRSLLEKSRATTQAFLPFKLALPVSFVDQAFKLLCDLNTELLSLTFSLQLGPIIRFEPRHLLGFS